MSFANQTVFAKMVDDFGNQLLSGMQTYFFNSSLVQFLIAISVTVFLITIAFSIKNGMPKFKDFLFILAWLACLPYSGKPLGFTAINSLGSSISYALEKSINFAMNQATTSGGNGMPPYYAANAFIRAASAKITDPNVKTEIGALMQNCVPDPGAGIVNNDGKPLSGIDLLIPTKTPPSSAIGSYSFNFDSTAQNVLKNTPSHITDMSSGTPLNCYDLMVKTQTDIRTDMLNQNLTSMPNSIAVGSAPGSTNQIDFTQPTSVAAQGVQDVSLNMASAISASYVAAGLGNPNVGGVQLNSIDPNVMEVAKTTGGLAGMSLTLHNTFDGLGKMFGVSKSWDVGAKLSELNEKLYMLPSMVATAQVWLKVLAPLAFLSMMFGTMRIVLTWGGMWFATLIFPVVANVFGSYLSALILTRYQFNGAAITTPNNANFLMTGESINAIGDVMRDFSSMVDTTLNYQLASFALISSLVIGGAWFSHKLSNSGMVSALGSAGRMMFNSAVFGAGRAFGAAAGATRLAGGENLKTLSSASAGSSASASDTPSAARRASFFTRSGSVGSQGSNVSDSTSSGGHSASSGGGEGPISPSSGGGGSGPLSPSGSSGVAAVAESAGGGNKSISLNAASSSTSGNETKAIGAGSFVDRPLIASKTAMRMRSEK